MDLLMREPLDAQAFDALSRRLRRPLYAFVTAVMLDPGAAEDVTQRAFELALARRQSFRPERGSVEAWLFWHRAQRRARRAPRARAPLGGRRSGAAREQRWTRRADRSPRRLACGA
jgi:DNA-directed RNA polymerase specialized sigma24 family protein